MTHRERRSSGDTSLEVQSLRVDAIEAVTVRSEVQKAPTGRPDGCGGIACCVGHRNPLSLCHAGAITPRGEIDPRVLRAGFHVEGQPTLIRREHGLVEAPFRMFDVL